MLFHRRQAETSDTAPYRYITSYYSAPKVRDLEKMSDLQVRDLERSHCTGMVQKVMCAILQGDFSTLLHSLVGVCLASVMLSSTKKTCIKCLIIKISTAAIQHILYKDDYGALISLYKKDVMYTS